MNIIKEFCYWVEDNFVLTLRGLMVLIMAGLFGFMLGGLVSLYCMISIMESMTNR